MPNWCSNTLKVHTTDEGSKKAMVKFQKKIGDGKELLSKFIPLPQELKDVHSGGCTIDGKSHTRWLQIDGKNVAIPQKVLDGWWKKYGAHCWYDWCCNEWGTKWDTDGYCNVDDEEYIELDFDTAWCPPMEWFNKVVKKYPTLHFTLKYEEEGCGFLGLAKGTDGQVDDQCIEY